MGDDRDPPIEPLQYLRGVTVVDFGDVRVARGMTRRPVSTCPHVHLIYDNDERRVWCKDCEHDVDGFDAFRMLAERCDVTIKAIKAREDAVSEAERFQIRSIAAKKMDEAWRHRDMVPACPYCKNGLFPEDFKNGVSLIGKDFAKGRSMNRKGD